MQNTCCDVSELSAAPCGAVLVEQCSVCFWGWTEDKEYNNFIYCTEEIKMLMENIHV